MKTFRGLKRLFFALIIPGMFFVGILLGYQLHKEGVAYGCFPLKEDLSIAPIQTEKKGVVKFGVIGDTGTANLDQQEVADHDRRHDERQMNKTVNDTFTWK